MDVICLKDTGVKTIGMQVSAAKPALEEPPVFRDGLEVFVISGSTKC